jgi:hypothetical protein
MKKKKKDIETKRQFAKLLEQAGKKAGGKIVKVKIIK